MGFDSSLVIVPSRQGFYYRLAQRRKLQLTENVINEALFAESDTKMLASHSLIPVTTIKADPNWGNPILFQELRERCPSMLGGHEKVSKMLEDREFASDMQKRAATEEHLTHLGKDAWKYYNMKLGTRSGLFSHKMAKAPPAPVGIALLNPPKPYQPLVTTGFIR